MYRYRLMICLSVLFLFWGAGSTSLATGKKDAQDSPKKIEIPAHVINIEKENTHPNRSEDLPQLKPSEFTKELIESANEPIENPNLIQILNESAINKSLLAIGVRATIFMGEYPLHYKSEETIPNWQYQKVNTNVYDNNSGGSNHQINYVQQAHKRIKGGLTSKVTDHEDVQNMMLLKAMEKSKLPLTMDVTIGAGTKHHQVYNINPQKVGYLDAYVPALVEKGEVTYGEVYLVMKGSKRKLEVRNVKSQKVGAWIPIRDHVALMFRTSP